MLTLKVIAGEKTEKNLWGKGKGDCWGENRKNLSGKPVSIYNEVNTLCSGAT